MKSNELWDLSIDIKLETPRATSVGRVPLSAGKCALPSNLQQRFRSPGPPLIAAIASSGASIRII